MESFHKSNPNLKKTMNTRLIRLESYGIWENDYDKFFDKRCRAIAKEIAKRVILQNIDKSHQAMYTDDYDEPDLIQE